MWLRIWAECLMSENPGEDHTPCKRHASKNRPYDKHKIVLSWYWNRRWSKIGSGLPGREDTKLWKKGVGFYHVIQYVFSWRFKETQLNMFHASRKHEYWAIVLGDTSSLDRCLFMSTRQSLCTWGVLAFLRAEPRNRISSITNSEEKKGWSRREDRLGALVSRSIGYSLGCDDAVIESRIPRCQWHERLDLCNWPTNVVPMWCSSLLMPDYGWA